MIGDINLILSGVEEDGGAGNKWGTLSNQDHRASYTTSRMIRQAEVDVMMALPSHCKCSLGAKIAFTMMHSTLSCLKVSRFYAKIHKTNVLSLLLFEHKLRYERCNYATFFGKY